MGSHRFLIGLIFVVTICLWQCDNSEDVPINPEDVPINTYEVDIQAKISISDFGYGEIESVKSFDEYLLVRTVNDAFIEFNTSTSALRLVKQLSGGVTDFAIASDGLIGVGTERKGIFGFRLDGTDVFHKDTLNSCMPSNWISSIGFGNDDEVYFGCLSAVIEPNTGWDRQNGFGLYKTSAINESCSEILTDSSGLLGNLIQKISPGVEGDIWIGVAEWEGLPSISYASIPSWVSAGIHRIRNDDVIETFSLSIQMLGYDLPKEVRQLYISADGKVMFNLYDDQDWRYRPYTYSVEIADDGSLQFFGPCTRCALKFVAVLSSGERLIHGTYSTFDGGTAPTGIAYFLAIEEDDGFVELPESVDRFYGKGMVVTSDDRVWMADSENIYELIID